MTTQEIVSKLWNLCNVLRDDGITYHQYVTELTYILFLKMCNETGSEDRFAEGITLAEGNALTPEQETEVIQKLVKQNKESIDTCPADRTDILRQLQFERDILVRYMPKQMDADEIRAVIGQVLAELNITAPTAKDKGRIMKNLMPLVKGKADGKMVNDILAAMSQ